MVRVSKFNHVQKSGNQDTILSYHNIRTRNWLSKTAKFTTEQATKAHRATDVKHTLSITFGDRWGWVVNATIWPIYPQEWHIIHCIVGWVDRRAELNVCGNYHPLRVSIPDLPAHSNVLPSTDEKDAHQVITFWERGNGIHMAYYLL